MDGTYKRGYLYNIVSRATQLNTKERKIIMGLPNEIDDLFGVTMSKWETQPVYNDIKLEYNPVSSRYYPVEIINKIIFLISIFIDRNSSTSPITTVRICHTYIHNT